MYARDLSLERLHLAVLDALAVALALATALVIRHIPGAAWLGLPVGVPWGPYVLPGVLAAGGMVVLLSGYGAYRRSPGRASDVWPVTKAATLLTLALLAATFFYRGYSYSRATVLVFYPLAILLVLGGRRAYRGFRGAVRARDEAARRVVVAGAGEAGLHLASRLLDNPAYYQLLGFLDDDAVTAHPIFSQVPVLGALDDLERVAKEQRADEVLVALPHEPPARVLSVLEACMRAGVEWKIVPHVFGLRLERLRTDQVGDLPLVGLRGSNLVGLNWAVKRAFDVTVAGAAMAVMAPLFAAVALAVRLSSRGPVLYRQTRIGWRGRPFTFLKFRTMVHGASAAVHEAYTAGWIYGRTGDATRRSVGAAAAPEAPVHKLTRDPRVTRVGRWLRRFSLDELPQLWNVLRGDMSLVGPRPGLPYEVERYTEWHRRRLEVRPGITGPWQVGGRNRLSFDAMVRLDVDYIENWSLGLDLRILARTLPAVILDRAY